MRDIAKAIVRMRQCLIMGEVAKIKEDPETLAVWEAEFERAMQSMPFYVQLIVTHDKGSKYLHLPVLRQIRREGVLAQNDRYHL